MPDYGIHLNFKTDWKGCLFQVGKMDEAEQSQGEQLLKTYCPSHPSNSGPEVPGKYLSWQIWILDITMSLTWHVMSWEVILSRDHFIMACLRFFLFFCFFALEFIKILLWWHHQFTLSRYGTAKKTTPIVSNLFNIFCSKRTVFAPGQFRQMANQSSSQSRYP